MLDPNGIDLDSWERALKRIFRMAAGVGFGREAAGAQDLPKEFSMADVLSILVASLGTPYEIQTAGTILFIEDIAAKPYQIDRMLMQLKLAGKLDEVRGIVFGEMVDCTQNKDQRYSLQDVILRVVGDLAVPVAFGLRSGHVLGETSRCLSGCVQR